MKFLIIGEYSNRITDAVDFCEAADHAEWHGGEHIRAIVLLDDYIIEYLTGENT